MIRKGVVRRKIEPPAIQLPQLLFYKDGFGIKYPTKFDMLLN